MKNLVESLKGIYESDDLRRRVVPLYLGDPGLGKTHLIYEFAKSKGVNITEFITSSAPPFEVSGVAIK